jgi:predicted TIM-barrel fold metal-dependent hydrolase
MRILDAHCVFGRWPKAEADLSAERLLDVLAGMGVDRGVCVSLRGVFYDYESGNAETLAVCARNERLLPAATINPRHYHSRTNQPADLARQGFRMLRLFSDLQNWSPNNVVFERTLNECVEADLPVAFPIGKFPDLASVLARVAPQGCRLILSNAYYNELSETVEVMRRRPEFLLELGHTCVPGSIEYLVRDLGADRLILGTGQPLESGVGQIESIRRAEISDADKSAILGGTLARLLGGVQ